MGDRVSLERYALLLAGAAALRSEDPYHRVGCVLVRLDKTVAAVGYNGPPPGIDIDWSDRDQRRSRIVHAEANALRYVRPGEVLFAATTMMPCATCVLSLASYGIKLVVYSEKLDQRVYPIDEIRSIAEEVGVNMYHVEER